MFHRVPSFSFIAVATTALIFLLAVLFASSLSLPGTAHADHGESRPTVSITALMPEVGEEGSGVTVTLKLSRPLTADEKYCYNAVSPSDPNFRKDQVCIEGGIKIEDSYHDHLYESETTRPSDDATKFIFYGRQVEDRVNIFIEDDECITPNRRIKIWIDTAYQDRDEHPDETKYGYDIDTTVHTVGVIGNDDDDETASLWPTFDPETHNSKSIMTCPSVETGATEGGDYNRAPTFDDSESPTFYVDENTAAGQDVGNPVSATDPESDTLTYSLQGQDAASFDIDSSSGQIETKAALDHEAMDTYHVAVFVRDSKNIHGNSDTVDDSSIDVTINVTDVNEPPDTPAAPTVAAKTGTTDSLDVEWTAPVNKGKPDITSYELQYRVKDTDPPAPWTTDSVSRTDTNATITGLSSGTTYEVQVKASNDEGDSGWSLSGEGRTSNSAPTFDEEIPQGQTSLTRSVPENSDAGVNVGPPVSATDTDGDTLTYSLQGADADSFTIAPESGQIQTTTGVTYDHETQETYSVEVKADDEKDGTDTIAVTITVTDLDEAGTITFSSDPPSAGTALTATLADDDGVKSSPAVTWKWESSPNGTDTWTEITGETTNSYTPGTDDIGDYLRVTATYEDEFPGSKTAEKVSQAVRTAPVTNQQPSFADSTTTREVAENTSAGQNIGAAVSATHADRFGTLVYSLGGTDAASFEIDANTGQLKTKTVFDYETDAKISYTVTVSVTDGLDDHSLSDALVDDTITVTINVTDVNEKPVFDATPPVEYEIVENTDADTNIDAALSASDEDQNETLTYGLTGTDAASFDIDTTSGQVKTKAYLDHETKETYSVTVTVRDSRDDNGDPDTATDATIDVTITITNIFEDPEFDDEIPQGQSAIIRTVPENTAANQNIGAPVSASDDEEGTLTYRLAGTDDTSFAIDTTTGQLKTKTGVDLDHETTDTYSVTVWVSDGKASNGDAEDPPQDDTYIDVIIEVTDLNEMPVFDANSPVEYEIVENTDADTNIDAALSASDEDQNETLTYGLTGTDAASFDIDTTSGQVKTKAYLDHETKETYSVTVTVRDSRDDNGDPDTATDATIDVTITVTDEDEDGKIILPNAPPSAGNSVTAVLEDQDGIKTDVDVEWVWSISTDQTNWTPIDGATTDTYIPQADDIGKYLQVTATYDDEFGTDKTAVDETAAVLTLTATNLQPSFEDTTATWSIQENTAADTYIGDAIEATHPDSVGTLVYSLDTTSATSFDIDSATGQLKTKAALDHETTPSYTVTVSVTDEMDDYSNADTRVDDTIEVTINVTDMLVPDVPEEPTVSATQGAAAGLTATWAAIEPEDDSPVDGYDVRYRVKDATPPDWGSANVTVTGVTATITGLEYSTTYEVEVRSKNVEGNSEWSPTGEGTIPSSLSVSFSSGSQTVDEGSSATFTVAVSPAADRELSIPISATRGTAEADDYSVSGLTDGTLTFADTESSKTFTVSTNTDSDRSDETVDLAFGQLPAAVGTGTQSTAQLTINDTTPTPRGGGGGGGTIPSSLSVSFGQAIYTVTEGNTSLITVNVSPAADRALSIPISATQGSAESDDYSVSGTPLVFASGDASKTFRVSTISDPDMDDEIVNLAFGQLPASVVEGPQATSQLTIEDTTTAPSANAVPEFDSDATTTLFVPENTPEGENIGDPFTATDDDDSTLTYSLDDQDGASFEVDASGQIKTKSALDYETRDQPTP